MSDVSVVIPCYNAERYIAATLDSVLAQTDPPGEVIVVDDGSKDGSAAIVEGYVKKHPGIVTLIRQANAGESTARNVAIARSKGAFIALVDSDDVWLPDKLAKQMTAFARWPEAVGVHTAVFNFSQTLDDAGRAITEKTKDNPTVTELMEYHFICPSTAVLRRSAFTERGLKFDEKVRHAEDMLFFADASLIGPLRLVDEPLVGKRVHAKQQSRDPWHFIYSLESRINWCRSRTQALGAERAANMEANLADKLIKGLDNLYWHRQIQGLAKMRTYVRGICPAALAASDIGKRRIWPAWVYKVRDRVWRR